MWSFPWGYIRKRGIYAYINHYQPPNSPSISNVASHHLNLDVCWQSPLYDDLGTNCWIGPGMLAIALFKKQRAISIVYTFYILFIFHLKKKDELPMMVTSLVFLPFHEKPIGKTGCSESTKILWLDPWRRPKPSISRQASPHSHQQRRHFHLHQLMDLRRNPESR